MVDLSISLRKRQNENQTPYGYLNQNGSITNACSGESNVIIADGRLVFGGKTFFTTIGTISAPFTAGYAQEGDIETSFDFQNDLLVWSNEAFDAGRARFCVTRDNEIDVIFKGAIPANCVEVDIVVQSSK